MKLYQFKGRRFRWEPERVDASLHVARREQALFSKQIGSLKTPDRLDAQVEALSREVAATLSIAGENLEYAGIESLVARRLRAARPPSDVVPDPRVHGIVEILLDAARNPRDRLDEERVRYWYLLLGREHSTLEQDLVQWCEAFDTVERLLCSAVAFVLFPATGLIRRTVSVMALAQDNEFSQRYLSLSEQVWSEKRPYRDTLQGIRRGLCDITEWLTAYLDAYVKAVDEARTRSAGALRETRFWTAHRALDLTHRQIAVLNHHLRSSQEYITARSWAETATTSVDTAQRDLRDLVMKGVLTRNPPGGKKTSYFPAFSCDTTMLSSP